MLSGSDRYYEMELRSIAQVMDWEQQKQLFRSLLDHESSRYEKIR